MSGTRNWLLGLLLAGVVLVILLTWGSVGSAILTLALLLSVIFLLWKRSMDRDNDYEMED